MSKLSKHFEGRVDETTAILTERVEQLKLSRHYPDWVVKMLDEQDLRIYNAYTSCDWNDKTKIMLSLRVLETDEAIVEHVCKTHGMKLYKPSYDGTKWSKTYELDWGHDSEGEGGYNLTIDILDASAPDGCVVVEKTSTYTSTCYEVECPEWRGQ